MKKKTTVISIGNGGFNIAREIFLSGTFSHPEFIIVDTNEDELKVKGANERFRTILLPIFEREVNSARAIEIKEVIQSDSERVVICTTLGGKTGTFYAPLIAMDSFLKGKEVHTLCTMPFKFEGKKRLTRAEKAASQLYYASNIFITQNNNRLTDFKSMKLGDLDMPMVKYYRQIIEGEDFPMRTKALLQDVIEPISFQFPALSLEERIKKFNLIQK